MKHIFIVDDEKNIRDLIKKFLVSEGYEVTLFKDGLNLVDKIKSIKPDLIVLDVMMPGIDGLELCKEIRKISLVPIIFVSAKDEEIDKILGLELGADDYLAKPFSPRELVVRIKNILKRTQIQNKDDVKVINIKDVNIYRDRRSIKKGDFEIKFTTKEYDLIEFLVNNKNMPFTRDQLLERIWGYDFVGDERAIDDLVKKIRKKLNEAGSTLDIITVWGYGYKVDE